MTLAGRIALDELRRLQGLDDKLPWGGRSPRALTRAYEAFRLEPRGDDAEPIFDEEVTEEQYRRFKYGA